MRETENRMTTRSVQFGLDTFGDVSLDEKGAPNTQAQVLRDIVEQAASADLAGIDSINIGEHHRDDFAVSSPEMVLAAIASRTARITLGTAVTVLSSDDPVRLYERFATLEALSSGRAEITLGRGSFTESFPLFGHDLADYELLFAEKLDLFTKLRSEQPISWSGRTRSSLVSANVYPRTEAGGLSTWIGIGGSPESVVRAARHGLPIKLAAIGGDPSRFRGHVDLYHRVLSEHGLPPLPVGVHAPGFVAETDEEARELLFPFFKAYRDRLGQERGRQPVTRQQFELEVNRGALFVGSPRSVATKIARVVRQLDLNRFDLKYANGPMPHHLLLSSIHLYGTQVIPLVKDLLGSRRARSA